MHKRAGFIAVVAAAVAFGVWLMVFWSIPTPSPEKIVFLLMVIGLVLVIILCLAVVSFIDGGNNA